VFTPTDPAGGLPSLDQILAARAAGVDWTDLLPDGQLPDGRQIRQARAFVQFRQGLKEDEDPQTVQRAARILRAPDAAPSREKVWGLPDDPQDPAAADFSDVARALDQRAEVIHCRPAAPRPDGRGRHARQRLALPPGVRRVP
jgi:hypothetical protein